MPSLLTQHYRSQLGRAFLSKLQWSEVIEALTANAGIDTAAATAITTAAPPSVLYLFAGRPQEWIDAANAEVNDSHPPVPVETIQETSFAVWRDMLGAKRAYTANMNFVVARNDWVSGTVYDQYDDQLEDLAAANFYVLDTSDTEYRVYKCLWNAEGAPSTNSPSLVIGASATPTQTADGYTWQYLYTIPTTTDKFLTVDWMPVYSNTTVAAAAETNAGTLPTAVPFIIIDSGANYSNGTITTTIQGDGSGASVTSGVTIQGGRVTAVVLADGGAGYTQVTSINVYQVGATTATCRAIIPPYPNHGWDPITELGAKHIMVYMQLSASENDKLTVDNDYRRIGLLINPIDANTDAVANADFYRQTYDLVMTSNTGVFVADDEIFADDPTSGVTGTVVDVVQDANTDYVLRLTNVNIAGEAVPFPTGATFTTGVVECVVNTCHLPELTPYTGEVLYVNQRTPVVRSNTQYEELKVILPFGG